MSQLNNPNFISFSGEPITGRTPPKMIVTGGRTLSQSQYSGVMHAYKLFTDVTRLSLAGYVVQNKVLEDGTKVRMVSINKVDTVFVTPTGGGRQIKLPHGFGVVAYKKPRVIYGKVTAGTTATWKITHRGPPQLASVDKNSAYSLKYKFKEAKLILRPHIATAKNLWEWVRHGLTNFGKLVVPFSPTYPVLPSGEKENLMDFISDKLYTSKGEVLAEAKLPAQILGDGSDHIVALPPAVSMDENRVALQVIRYALISQTAGVYQFRYGVTHLQRTGPTGNLTPPNPIVSGYLKTTPAYTEWIVKPGMNFTAVAAQLGGAGCGLYNPALKYGGKTIAFGPDSAGGKDPKVSVYFGASGPVVGTSVFGDKYQQTSLGYWLYGSWQAGNRITLEHYAIVAYINHTFEVDENTPVYVENRNGWFDAYMEKTPIVPAIAMASVGGGTSILPVEVTNAISYPLVRKFFRNGFSKVDAYPTSLGVVGYWFYLYIQCINSEYWVESPKGDYDGMYIHPVWRKTPLKLFDPQTKGTLVGRYRYNWGLIRTRQYEPERPSPKTWPGPGADVEDINNIPPGPAIGDIYTLGMDRYNAVLAAEDCNDDMNAWIIENTTNPSAGEYIPPIPSPQCNNYDPNTEPPDTVHQMCVNKVDYEFKSRYILDFDLPARFVAFLLVTVKCEQYEAHSRGPGQESILDQIVAPKYTVTISFESEWLPTLSDEKTTPMVASKLLYSGTFTRTPYECSGPVVANPWNEADLRLWWFRMPPKISPPVGFYNQLVNIAKDQGQNPCFAGSTNHPGAPLVTAAMESKAGVEYSITDESGRLVKGLDKYSPGMLYSRSFKLSDFMDAYWLFKGTKIDIKESDNDLGEGPTYFYLPSLAVALGIRPDPTDSTKQPETFNIRLRDGVLVDWLADIPDSPVPIGQTAPALPAGMPDVNIYRI